MIITKISGGLGNQMFQYAAGRAVSLRENTSLKLDISGYSDDKFGRHYSLDVFNIKVTLATPLDCLISRLFKTYLDGYWQSEKYFIEYSDQIRQDFKLKPRPDKNVTEYLKKIKKTNSVAIHVRRGDYVSIARIGQSVGICGVKYYQRAIRLITKKVKDPTFFVFSEADGLDWAKQNLKFESPCVLVKSSKDYEDLRLMSACQHNIVANSSFSWWGAWLNENPKKIVVAPDPWFDRKKTNIVPENWAKLKK